LIFDNGSELVEGYQKDFFAYVKYKCNQCGNIFVVKKFLTNEKGKKNYPLIYDIENGNACVCPKCGINHPTPIISTELQLLNDKTN